MMGERAYIEHNRSAHAKILMQTQDHLMNQLSAFQIINYIYEFETNYFKEFQQFMLTVFQSRHKYLKTSYYFD